MGTPQQGEVLWTPPPDARSRTEIGRFMDYVRDERGHDFATYEELWQWSVTDLEGFWGAIWDFFQVRAHTPPECVLRSVTMPGAEWFPGARLSYAEHIFRGKDPCIQTIAVCKVVADLELIHRLTPRPS